MLSLNRIAHTEKITSGILIARLPTFFHEPAHLALFELFFLTWRLFMLSNTQLHLDLTFIIEIEHDDQLT